ncbi:hypothetical protein BRSU_0083 [Brachyspira suanatina]|uniref:Uncharacterized protein n=1 Tax=Brachyspira suanatina TaxID=381802 RepID=A0A0G4K357_9SPIR|nr:YidC/Oxa1 family membrane protein insertase [Brachyspira suanatina]CRF31397.1 hypothetical protein BRSU_0083 [Brachyspira suanatina]
MGLSDFLYNVFIYPIEFILETSFYFFKVYTKSSYVVSIFFISLVVNFISLPLYNIAERWQQKERDIQNKMKPMIDNIKSVFKGDQRYLLIRTCQRIHGYKTIYAFRGTLGILIQIPFFIAAYHFIHNLDGLEFGQLGYITNLSKPDELLKIGNISINILPFIMTIISLLASLVYSKKLTIKEQMPLYITNLIFLLLLYNSPAGLLFYWTVNCTFSLVKNIVLENYSFFKAKIDKIFKNKIIMAIIKRVSFTIFIIFTIFIFVYTLLYLYRDTIFAVSLEKQYLKIFRVDVKTYKDVLSIWAILFAIVIYKKYLYKLFNIKLNNNNTFKLLAASSISITLLAGLFIPSTLIASSGQEFSEPFTLILNNISKYIGFFFVYSLFIYSLFSSKIKNILSLLLIYISVVFFVDTFIIIGNYGNISSSFVFDNAQLLNTNFIQIILNITVVSLFILIIYLLLKKDKVNILINIYVIISLVLFSISIYDIIKINKEQQILSDLRKGFDLNLTENNYNNIFNLSKTGTNVFVIILDRAANSYVLDYLNSNEELKKEFNGFTLYTNVISYAEVTIGSLTSLMGGYEYLPYNISEESKYNLKDKFNESLLLMPRMFADNGYTANMFNTTFVNLNFGFDTSIFSGLSNINAYAQNDNFIKFSVSNILNDYEELNDVKEAFDNKLYDINNIDLNIKRAFRFSIFRIIPSFLRSFFYSNSDWYIFSMDSSYYINKSLREFAVLNSIKHITSINDNGNYFNFIHSESTHEPEYVNNDLLPSIWKYSIPSEDYKKFGNEFQVRSYYANCAAIDNLITFLHFIKDNDIYNNTKIIIVSDHAFILDTEFFKKNSIEFMSIYNPLLMYKDFNSTNDFNISSEFMTVADIPYLSTIHLTNRANPFTGNILSNDSKNKDELKLLIFDEWQPERQLEKRFNFSKYYTVKGNIFDKNNWKLNTFKK